MRGLKLDVPVAVIGRNVSHPPRVRGLKQDMAVWHVQKQESHPPRVRGLKPITPKLGIIDHDAKNPTDLNVI